MESPTKIEREDRLLRVMDRKNLTINEINNGKKRGTKTQMFSISRELTKWKGKGFYCDWNISFLTCTKIKIYFKDDFWKQKSHLLFYNDQSYLLTPMRLLSYPDLSSIRSFRKGLNEVNWVCFQIWINFLKIWHLYCLLTFPRVYFYSWKLIFVLFLYDFQI